MAGMCVAGLLAAELALVGVPFGVAGLATAATVLVALGGRSFLRRRQRGRRHEPSGLWGARVIGAAALAQIGLLLGVAGSAFAVRPLVDWDGWAIWGLKARALFELGGVSNPVFTSHVHSPHMQDYPLFLPALEATGYRFVGGVDERLIHLQLLGFAVGFVGALWSLLRPRVSPELLGLSLL